MHNHDDSRQGSWMMWAMAACCMLPFLLIFVLGAGGKASGVSLWVILGGIAIIAAVRFFLVGKPRKHSDEQNNADNKDDKTHFGHGCCH